MMQTIKGYQTLAQTTEDLLNDRRNNNYTASLAQKLKGQNCENLLKFKQKILQQNNLNNRQVSKY